MLFTLRLILPALIPSWRFFETIAPSPRVEMREIKGNAAGPWREAMPRPVRLGFGKMLARMLWNAPWNEALFLMTAAERFIATEDVFFEQEIFRRVAARTRAAGNPLVQFRLVFVTLDESGQLARHVLYKSAARPRSEALT